MIERKRNGTRRIELLVPCDVGCGRIIDVVEIKACTLDHVLRWQAGLINDPLALLAELSGLGADILGQLTYPDADIVMQEFALHVPAAIRGSLGQTAIVPAPPAEAPAQEPGPPLPPELETSEVDSEMFKVA